MARVRSVALGALLVAVTLGRYSWNIAGYNVKLEHIVIAGVLVATLVAARNLSGLKRLIRPSTCRASSVVRRPSSVVHVGPLLWTLPYLGVLALSSVVNSPDSATSLRHTAMLALVVSGAWLVYHLTDSLDRLRAGVWMLVGLGLLEAIFTYIALVATSFGVPLGTQVGNGGIVVPYGTLWEPNILGSFLAAAGAILLAKVVVSDDGRRTTDDGPRTTDERALTNKRSPYGLVGGLILILSALGLSLARASWLGFGVGSLTVLFCYVWVQRSSHQQSASTQHSAIQDEGRDTQSLALAVPWQRALRAIALALGGTLLLLGGVAPFAFPNTFQGIFVRLDFRYFRLENDPAVQARVTALQGALDGIVAHPIIGNGAGSYGINHVGEHGEPGWIGNLEVHALYDGGALALSLFFGGLGALVWRAWRAVTSPLTESGARADIIGLLGATAVLLIAFQATEGTWLGYSWVYIGLLARAGSKFKVQSSKFKVDVPL